MTVNRPNMSAVSKAIVDKTRQRMDIHLAHSSRELRIALGAFATGVTIVTTRDPAGQDVGLTVNSFSSVSLQPPMVLWSLSRASLSLPAFLGAECFAVHVLAADQEDLSTLFATRGMDKFAGLQVGRGAGDIPLLDGCAARFQCRTTYHYEGGDHVIFVGEVLAFEQTDRKPLVFHDGAYAIAARKARPAQSEHLETQTTREDGFSRDFLLYLLGQAHYGLFRRLRRELQEQGLTESDLLVLSLLGAEDNQTVADLDSRVAYTGTIVTYDQIAHLAAAQFVSLQGAYDPERVRASLTERGRQAVIRLAAATKAAEADAERDLGYDEVALLKQWLRNIIHTAGPVEGGEAAIIAEGSSDEVQQRWSPGYK